MNLVGNSIEFEDYFKNYQNEEFYKKFFLNNYEIKKQVVICLLKYHPITGTVYNFLFLCKFYEFLNEMKENNINNILYFWISWIFIVLKIEIKF